jgi:hypothetical protein
MRGLLIAACVLALACATPPPPAQTEAGLWGYVKLAPKHGVRDSTDSYADRRLRSAPLFDYSHPVFAVVETADAPQPPPSVRTLVLEARGGEVTWKPARLALGLEDSLRVDNRTAQPQIVSAPGLDFVGEIAPGASITLKPRRGGELELFRLGASQAQALAWVASGAYAVADSTGRYELRGLPPGPIAVRAWHPRLPPSAPHTITLAAGQLGRLDLEVGVDRAEEAHE